LASSFNFGFNSIAFFKYSRAFSLSPFKE